MEKFSKLGLMFGLTSVLLAGTAFTSVAADKTQDVWYINAQKTLEQKLAQQVNTGKAKNVIVFVADGNGVNSNAALRIYDGQQKGMSGEDNVLSYEALPNLALVKTYNTDAQTPDSAGTMSAIVTGVKTKQGVLSIDDSAGRGDCKAAPAASVSTFAELAEDAGMATGVVSTARITHATPAAVYSHSADRNWEDDSKVKDGCEDIASQLLSFAHGDGIDVVFGGGRRHFISKETVDGEGKNGKRTDGRDLTAEWTAKSNNHQYVWDQAGFDKIDLASSPKVLGLFNSSHMEYEADRANDKGGEPSLAEMTSKAIDLLSQNENGYFLAIESGRVDHAHHAGNAARALEDGVAFNQAVEAALAKVDLSNTLVIVTADHAHTLTLSGYAKLGNPILGLSLGKDGKPNLAKDGKPYTVLNYTNGPGGVFNEDGTVATRQDLTNIDTQHIDYIQQALIPLGSETHSGSDVAVYAAGPWSHLLNGTIEQNFIYHVIDHATGMSDK